jgi:hypothetical protein
MKQRKQEWEQKK